VLCGFIYGEASLAKSREMTSIFPSPHVMPSYQTAMGLIIFGPEKWFDPVAISFNRIKALPMMTEHERRKALGFWGERKALTLLSGAKFVRDLKRVNIQSSVSRYCRGAERHPLYDRSENTK
jgi:hypothetical protein